jgi:hypothetical protein
MKPEDLGPRGWCSGDDDCPCLDCAIRRTNEYFEHRFIHGTSEITPVGFLNWKPEAPDVMDVVRADDRPLRVWFREVRSCPGHHCEGESCVP